MAKCRQYGVLDPLDAREVVSSEGEAIFQMRSLTEYDSLTGVRILKYTD